MLLRGLRLSLLLLCGLVRVLPAAAQLSLPTVPVFAHYHSGNSNLPAEMIYKIHADDNGYLWLATDRGLVRYNGREFRLISTGPVEDFVSSCMAGHNRLWLFAYSGHTAGIDLNTQKTIPTDSLYGLNRLQDASMLFLAGIRQDSLLSLYSQRSKRVLRIRLDTRQSWSQTQNIGEIADELLQLHRFSTRWQQALKPELESAIRRNFYGLIVKDSFITIGNRIFKTSPGKEAELYFDGAAYGIRAFIMGFARLGADLYLGGIHEIGFCRIKGFFDPSRKPGSPELLLPGESVTCVEKDYLGNIWVGTRDKGLFHFPYSEQGTLHYNKAYSGLYSDRINYIGRFPGDITVLGYGDAVAEFYLPGVAQPARYLLPATEDFRDVSHVEKTAYHWLMFTRNEAFFAGAQNDAFPGQFRHAVLKEPTMAPGYKSGRLRGNIFYYISSNLFLSVDTAGYINRYDMTRVAVPKKTCLLPLTDTDFYIGTVRGCYINARKLPYLQDAQVNAIDTVAGQLLWGTNIGTYAIPLNSAEDSRELRQLSAAPCTGLQHDSLFIYLRYADELTLVDYQSMRPVTRFSCRDYPNPFRLNDFYPDKDYLILAGNQGLFYIPKENLRPQLKQARPKMHVLCSLNEYAPADSAYRCRYKKGMAVLFKLDVLDYKKEQGIISCRVLKDGEELYIEPDLKDDGTVTLRPDGPGRYRVLYHVKSGYTGDTRELSYELVVIPLWYQQWWFLPLLIVFTGLAFAWTLFRIQDRRVKRRHRQLEQKIYLHELEAQSLLGQLKPHFIFNILTPLQGYLMRGEKLKGLDYLDHFSGLMRGMLQGIRHRSTSLTAEIAFLAQYLQVQQARFQHSFSYTIRTDPKLDPASCFIPSLLLQPLVENAIEHGIIKNRTDGMITISFEAKEDTVLITITDNGKGLPSGWTITPDHALAIISERVQLLKETKGTGYFRLASNEGGKGTTATLILAKDNRI